MRKISRFLDSIKATFSPSGSVYYGPIMSIDLNTFFYALPCPLDDDKVAEEIEATIVAREVKIKSNYMKSRRLQWDQDLSGITLSVRALLELLDKVGCPGYDEPVAGLKLHYGIGRFGRELYAFCPTNKESNTGNITLRSSDPHPIKTIDSGRIEMYPFRENEKIPLITPSDSKYF
jgi:hypothetical protein